MVEKVRSNAEDLRLAQNTLRVRDPEGVTVAVGSLAILAQTQAAGIELPIGCADVDVLCPQDFFEDLLHKGPWLEGVNKFQVRWPKGRLLRRGATNKSIDIYPENSEQLPFTACYSMSDLWFPIDHDSCQPDVVEASGIACLKIGRMLEWAAVVGRDKDVQQVGLVLPVARKHGLVNEDEAEIVTTKLAVSLELRAQYPERYYAQGLSSSS